MATQEKRKFRKIRSVTLPHLKLIPGVEFFVAFLGPMHLGEKRDDQKEPPMLARVLDMDTGEEAQIICPAILVKELDEGYSGGSYVGKGFGVSITRVADKKYNMVNLYEVGIPDDVQPAVDELRKIQGKGEGDPVLRAVETVTGDDVIDITPEDLGLNAADGVPGAPTKKVANGKK